ncbi:MAG: 50S ribosomal protein L10 [Alphaproteobacteria bacterium GM202ARS2]|nr:50S ribosomal protein L10 [Alphaproteobacteria bacterium GM202ARS2]
MTTRAQKQQMIDDVKALSGKMALLVVVERGALSVAESEQLRKQLRKEGGRFKVVKNRLMTHSFDDTQQEVKDPLLSMFVGQSAIAFSEDGISAARVVHDFAKDHEGKITIRGGVCDGTIIDLATVKQLATLPSLDVLRAGLIGLLQTPAGNLARLMREPIRRIAQMTASKPQ